MNYILALFSTLEMLAAAALLAMSWHSPHLPLFIMLFALCGANLTLRLREHAVEDLVAEAEEKVAKRVLRRLSKVMPELLTEYFKAQTAKPEEKLSDVIVGCTAANMNAAVGAALVQSAAPKTVPSKVEFNAFSTDGILIEGVLIPLKPGSLVVDKATRLVTCILDLYKDSRNDWKSQYEQIEQKLIPTPEAKVVKAYHPELAKEGIKYLRIKVLGIMQLVEEGERWSVSLEAYGNTQTINLLSS